MDKHTTKTTHWPFAFFLIKQLRSTYRVLRRSVPAKTIIGALKEPTGHRNQVVCKVGCTPPAVVLDSRKGNGN